MIRNILTVIFALCLSANGQILQPIFAAKNAATTIPVAFDVAAFAICSNGAGDCQIGGNFDLNLSVTVGSGSNRACIAAIGMSGGGSDTEPTPNIVTFGGVAMTNIPSASVTGDYYQLMYVIKNPTSGVNNVRFEVTGLGVGASKMSIGVVCASNVNQTTPTNTGTTASDTGAGSSTTGTQTFTNGANDLGVAAMCQGTGISSGTGTQRWVDNNSTGACSSYAGYTIAGGTTSVSYTFSAVDSWLFTVVSFKAA